MLRFVGFPTHFVTLEVPRQAAWKVIWSTLGLLMLSPSVRSGMRP